MSNRCHHKIVVDALTCAVVERPIVRTQAAGAGLERPPDVANTIKKPGSGLRPIIGSPEACVGRAVRAISGIDPCLAVGQCRGRELCATGDRSGSRLENLRKSRATVARATNPFAKGCCVDGAARRRVHLNMVNPATGAEARKVGATWKQWIVAK